ncbi:STAS domain-containing protein [Alishewanella longhuensis]
MVYSPFTLLNTLSGKVTFDFSALTNVDSAGLAWLIQQLARARTMNLQIEISKVPGTAIVIGKGQCRNYDITHNRLRCSYGDTTDRAAVKRTAATVRNLCQS